MRSNPSLRQVPQNALKRLEDSPQFASKPGSGETSPLSSHRPRRPAGGERQSHLFEVA